MHMQATHPVVTPSLLRRVLLGNTAFSTLCALACLFWTTPLSALFGLSNPTILIALAIALLPFALAVAWIATRPAIDRNAVRVIIGMDITWVLASAWLLMSGFAGLKTAGNWSVAIVALAVADFAILQTIGLRQLAAQAITR